MKSPELADIVAHGVLPYAPKFTRRRASASVSAVAWCYGGQYELKSGA